MSKLRVTGSPARSRGIARVVAALGIAALAGSIGACNDAPSAPAIAGSNAPHPGFAKGPGPLGFTTASVPVLGVLRDSAIDQITVQQTIGPEGGRIEIKEVGFRMDVPAGAVDTATVFTATALAGRAIAYDFKPSGTFPVALTIRQELKGTNWRGSAAALQGAYVRDLSTLDPITGSALSDEFEPTDVDPARNRLDFTVTHFSGYMISTGRY